jgi:hypothetical protein
MSYVSPAAGKSTITRFSRHYQRMRVITRPVIPGQPAGLNPESITTIGSLDSGLALRAPRNDVW